MSSALLLKAIATTRPRQRDETLKPFMELNLNAPSDPGWPTALAGWAGLRSNANCISLSPSVHIIGKQSLPLPLLHSERQRFSNGAATVFVLAYQTGSTAVTR